jgi:hypothetical protein
MASKQTKTKPSKASLICEPVCLIPFPPPTVQDRVLILKRGLDPKDNLYFPLQKTNLLALIQMYEQKEITVDDDVYVMEGRRVTAEECEQPKAPFFREVGQLSRSIYY